jgi:CheY-like chemotaxis protein
MDATGERTAMKVPQKLLFVDDEPNVLSALSRLLRRDGHEILTAVGGREALALLEDHDVAVIVSDQRMPAMTGAELLTECRRLRPDSVRIMLTAYADIDATIQAINEGGIFRYITKPWNDDELRWVIQQALAWRAMVAQNRQLLTELQLKNQALAQLNQALEEKVQERTLELRLRVQELEGKDEITRHMLTVHPLDETLEMILDVLSRVLGLGLAVLHLMEGEQLRPAAARGLSGGDRFATPEELQSWRPAPRVAAALDQAAAHRNHALVPGTLARHAVLPILRSDQLLGLIEIANPPGGAQLDEAVLRTARGFALQAAGAIVDAQTQSSMALWKQELDSILSERDPLECMDEQLGL